MSRAKFDRYMVAVGAGRHVKFRRLTVPERYAFFMGVLSIAARSQLRGALLIGNLRAEAEDIAAEADVPVKVARAALAKLRQVGMLIEDAEHDCEVVQDFADYNPAPKTEDRTALRRKQLQRNAPLRDAIRDRDGDDCRYCGKAVDWTDRRSPLGGTYDHVDPMVDNELDNLVVACRGCNAAKHNRTPEAAGMRLLPIKPRPNPGPGRGQTPTKSRPNEVEVEGEVEAQTSTTNRPSGQAVVVDIAGWGGAA